MEKKDAINQARWRVGVGDTAVKVVSPRINLDQNWINFKIDYINSQDTEVKNY